MNAAVGRAGMRPANIRRLAAGAGIVAAVALLAALPYLHVPTGGVLPGGLADPGSLQLLGLCLCFGALALSYDLLFGFTGLLSFGHGMYFAGGAYVFDIAVTRGHLTLWPALAVTVAFGLVVPAVLGAVSLRTSGIAFAMVTLAFAQAASITISRDPGGDTGGEMGLQLDYAHLPARLVGVLNTRYLYWLALALLVVVCAAVALAVRSRAGRVWRAIRENERRVEVLGIPPQPYKLAAFVLASLLATLCGVVYLLLIGGASPDITTAQFTLSLLVMVVLGGAGRGWGAVLGGVLYGYLDQRLTDVAGSDTVHGLPAVVRVPLSQPLFLLGVAFIVVVLFLPGGIAGTLARLRGASGGLPAALRTALPGSGRVPAERAPGQPTTPVDGGRADGSADPANGGRAGRVSDEPAEEGRTR